MIIRNIQPFNNVQLNSLIPERAVARGEMAWELTYADKGTTGSAKHLLVLDSGRAILDYTHIFFIIDTTTTKVIGSRPKSWNTFIVGNEKGFYFCASYLLMRLRANTINLETDDIYDVPGLGPYSQLELLIPNSNSFIAGIQNMGNPKYPEPNFGLLKKNYMDLEDIWNLHFPGLVTRPPVSNDGNIVVAQKGVITIINADGKILSEFKVDQSPISSSIGPDNLIYLIVKTKANNILYVMDFAGNIIWEKVISITQPNQPPLVSNDSMIFIIGSSKIEAIANGEKIWEFLLRSDHNLSQLASVTQDGNLLVADGNRVIFLNKSGDPIWIYDDNNVEDFVTQPVLDSRGRVYIATNNRIVVLK